jgi:alkylation response protein AidB-like acyl-CoA dehydrogenase
LEAGLNTFLSEEDQSIKARFEQFAKEELAPQAQAERTDPVILLQRAGQAGLFAIGVPKEFGGQGGPFFHTVLLAEAAGVYDPGFALVLAAQAMVIEFIKHYGSDAQRSTYLPFLARGELVGSVAYFEDDSLEPFSGTQTKVVNRASGKVLSGVKNLVVNGGLSQLVVALASEEVKGDQKRPGFWLVPSLPRPEIRVTDQGPYVGLRSAGLKKLEFRDCPLNDEDRLGGVSPGDATSTAKQAYEFVLSVGKTIMAASAVGMLEGLLGEAAKSMQNQELHGVPANQSQGLQWRLADIATEASAGQLLTYRAGWSKDEDAEEFLKYAAMCKLFTAKAARIHSGEAMQVLGLMATAADSHAERAYRDGKMFELCLGTNDEERVLLGRELGI